MAYRDDYEAAQHRRQALEKELHTVRTLLADLELTRNPPERTTPDYPSPTLFVTGLSIFLGLPLAIALVARFL